MNHLIQISSITLGISAGIAAYFVYQRQKPEILKNEENAEEEVEEEEEDLRMSAGNDLFKIDDEQVKSVFERVFLEQMQLAEDLLADDETVERGAVHMSNALAITGETEKLLNVLRESLSLSRYSKVLKYIPTADVRVRYLLQDALEDESIESVFA
ncbi:unnamed protein product [Caenorhabditis angaria]|uniref:Uncharacterized protein n=1 Tax=Caenorhabditis angaria TaxID=860376 RepID=A0A9P1IQM6_9PELO|nr:unnamed protein product [Caenorhabditis angaria]